MQDIVIIGGGLAGLCSSIVLAREGLSVTLVEKKEYPHHKVCGEYVSNEALPFLHSLNIAPEVLQPARIKKLELSSPRGRSLSIELGMGGFGVSRFMLDQFLYDHALNAGVNFLLERQVNAVHYLDPFFSLELSDGTELNAEVVIGAYGKRSKLDRTLDRAFFQKRSPYIGVKYHIRTNFPRDTIALYNFEDGYCGLNAIENDKFCLCYLTSRDNLKKYGTLPELERQVLGRNPRLRAVLDNCEHLYTRPEVINEISFANKETVKEHVLMAGDAAGMIAPLCGNGMAMAMHAAKLCAEETLSYFFDHRDRERLEKQYTLRWNDAFARRLWVGRTVQKFFGKGAVSEIAVAACKTSKPLTRWVINQTHGKVF